MTMSSLWQSRREWAGLVLVSVVMGASWGPDLPGPLLLCRWIMLLAVRASAGIGMLDDVVR